MLRIIILVLMLPLTLFGQLIPDTVMPFGGNSALPVDDYPSFFSNEKLDYMRTVLGINQHSSGGFSEFEAQRFAGDNIFAYPTGAYNQGAYIEPQTKWAGVTYFIACPALDADSGYNVKFKKVDGLRQGNSIVKSDSGVMLDSLFLGQGNRYDWTYGFGVKIRYYPNLRLKIDWSNISDSDAVIGTFTVRKVYIGEGIPIPDSIRFRHTITARELPGNDFTFLALTKDNTSDSFYTIYDDTTSAGASIKFSLSVAGACSVWVDTFKLHCQFGKKLIEDTLYNEEIRTSVGRSGYNGNIQGWFLKDTENPGNFRPYKYISDLIKETTFGWNPPVEAAAWLSSYSGMPYSWNDGFRDFVKIAKPKMLCTYLYPMNRLQLVIGHTSLIHTDKTQSKTSR
jgi:hypothetical protein